MIPSIVQAFMWACFLTMVNSSKATGTQLSRYPTNNEFRDLKSKIARLQGDVVTLKQENRELKGEVNRINDRIDSIITACTNNNDDMNDLNDRVDTIESNINIIIDQTGVDVENNLDLFLGNMEAQLVAGDSGYDSNVPTAPPLLLNLTDNNEDLLGRALFTLNAQNQELSSQMVKLQHQLSIQTEQSNLGTGTNQLNEFENRISIMESLVLSSSGKSQPSRGVGAGTLGQAASGADGGSITPQNEEALAGILETVRQGAVSFFSVAQTSSCFGSNGAPKAMPHNVEFVVKGGSFHGSNGTFICEISGYYFIIFTVRTFDHRYLGVNLMRNSESLTAIFSDKHKRSVMQTQSVIAYLAEGDRLWMRIPPNAEFGLHGDQYNMNTYSGFLLYKGAR